MRNRGAVILEFLKVLNTLEDHGKRQPKEHSIEVILKDGTKATVTLYLNGDRRPELKIVKGGASD